MYKFLVVLFDLWIFPVDNYNIDKHLKRSYHLVYYQVSEETGIMSSIRHLPQEVWTCFFTYSLIIIVELFFAWSIFVVDPHCKIILTVQFFQSTYICGHYRYTHLWLFTLPPFTYLALTCNLATVNRAKDLKSSFSTCTIFFLGKFFDSFTCLLFGWRRDTWSYWALDCQQCLCQWITNG